MINLVIDYAVAISLFTTVIFQQQFAVTSPKEGTDDLAVSVVAGVGVCPCCWLSPLDR
jgi:hypothetical protein